MPRNSCPILPTPVSQASAPPVRDRSDPAYRQWLYQELAQVEELARCREIQELEERLATLRARGPPPPYELRTKMRRYTNNDLGHVVEYPRSRISSIHELHPGDVVGFRRKVLDDTTWLSYWHLAVVEEVNCKNGSFVVIHYQPVFDDSYTGKTEKLSLFEKGVVTRTQFHLHAEEVWVLEFEQGTFCPVEEVLDHARSRIGEKDYNILFTNCETFAIWCKTGRQHSPQAATVRHVAVQHGARAAAKVGARMVELTCSVAKKTGTKAVGKVLRYSPVVAADAVCAVGFTAYDIMEAKKKEKAGVIDEAECRRAVNTRLSVAAADIGLTAAGTIFGGALAGPVGAGIGSYIGSSVGTVLGSMAAHAVYNNEEKNE